ncbi:N,N-dimethylformamidase beta subunit-like C-terminal domain-containing protein [Tumidithrix helvetica PCC 7403]|uniref:N,N-dimethylformamidase beta subunit family domain-containing protein n=1 Tax=Tumidithrix helvetica TaxID=3457545 RepID=UPI003CBA8DE1
MDKISADLLNRWQEEGTCLVLLRGSATVGHTLVASLFDNNGLSFTGITINYQWQHSENGSWIDIVGETARSLTLAESLIGQQVRMLANFADSLGSSKYVASSGVPVAAQNAIVLENQKLGITDWKLSNVATNNEIAGYGDATSINIGQVLNLKISLAQVGQYNLDVYRLGYYNGKGGRLIASVAGLNGVTQASPTITNASTKLVEYKWTTSYILQSHNDWTTGLYLVKLTDCGTGKQNYIQFVLRDDNRPADLGFQDAITTAAAYNNNGGYSVYDFNSIGGTRAYQVSFDRPFQYGADVGSEQFNNMLTWEYNMTRWLESQGYDVSYYTNLDVSTNPLQLYSQKIFLSVGHDEYWSMDERNNVQKARDNGINLAFFSANTAYWQVRFEASSSGQSNRVMTVYKDTSGIGKGEALDPIALTNPNAVTTLFRSPEVNRPENELLGVGYIGDWGANNVFNGFDYVVSNASDPYYANTGLKNGDKLTGLVGYEWDGLLNNGSTPTELVVLSRSPVQFLGEQPQVPPGTNTAISNAVRYTAVSGAKVFSTGSIQWVWGLDNDWVTTPRVENSSRLRKIKNWLRTMKKLLKPSLDSPTRVAIPCIDSRTQQIAVNVFADMGVKPQTPSAHIVVA